MTKSILSLLSLATLSLSLGVQWSGCDQVFVGTEDCRL